MNTDQLKKLEADLWRAADTLRANSDLKASEYSTPVLGLIFLKFADNIYRRHEADILAEHERLQGTRMDTPLHEIAIERCGFYLPNHARYEYLLQLPDQENLAEAIKKAMEAIEKYKPELAGVLPQDEYFRLTRNDSSIPRQLLRYFADIPQDADGDMFGQIYEYFLGEFAMAEGQDGGEFFTPRSVVRLMVEIIEPTRGTVFDPACGSGGMFVQSAQFVEQQRRELALRSADASAGDIYVYGQEKNLETVKLARMNLAVNGLRGDIRQAITYYEDHFDSLGKFDYVLANPPFNVNDVNFSRVQNDPRFKPFGVPRNKSKTSKQDQGTETVPNANYLWINLFATSLKPTGRAALVMANSASDARHSEAEIRQKLIENNVIYGILTLPSNMFYTVTLPATLWFFDLAQRDDERILFIDARNIFTQVDRAHREFSAEQIQNISIISKLHKGRRADFVNLIDLYFAQGMDRLIENSELVKPVSLQLGLVLASPEGEQAINAFLDQWAALDKLRVHYDRYLAVNHSSIDAHNQSQHELRAAFEPLFTSLHETLRHIDRLVRIQEQQRAAEARAVNKRASVDKTTRDLKQSLEKLHSEVRAAESFYSHIRWLQERFPHAAYEDVIGLCKIADRTEIAEQDFSLNPGRYVGVVIEDDGKTTDEFVEELLNLTDELERFNAEAITLAATIAQNAKLLVGEL